MLQNIFYHFVAIVNPLIQFVDFKLKENHKSHSESSIDTTSTFVFCYFLVYIHLCTISTTPLFLYPISLHSISNHNPYNSFARFCCLQNMLIALPGQLRDLELKQSFLSYKNEEISQYFYYIVCLTLLCYVFLFEYSNWLAVYTRKKNELLLLAEAFMFRVV